jgi:hypothetical protein
MDSHQDAYEWERSCHHSAALRALGVAVVVVVLAVMTVFVADFVQSMRDFDGRISGFIDLVRLPDSMP